MNSNEKPVLTIEQFTAIYSALGHAATQDQLNDVRKELDSKIDKRFFILLGALLANLGSIIALAFWLGTKLPG